MSSIDQAFVKAFARRQAHQALEPSEGEASGQASLEAEASRLRTADDSDSRPQIVSTSTQDESVTARSRDPRGLTIDESVADSTAVWVDTAQGQQLRADNGSASLVPPPQFANRQNGSGSREAVRSGAPSTLTSSARTNQDPLTYAYETLHSEYALGTMAECFAEWSAGNQPAENLGIADSAEALVEPQPPSTAPDGGAFEGTRIDRSHSGGSYRPDQIRSETDAPAGPSSSPTEKSPAENPASASAETSTPETESSPEGDRSIAPQAIAKPFRAVWEVDAFELPAPVQKLFFASRVSEQVAGQLSQAINDGLRSMLITSVKSGEGRSTVATGIAMTVASAGYRVALIDADVQAPTLADELRLDVEFGWLDAIRGGLPIEEVSVHAISDGVTLVPLMPPQERTAASGQEIESLVAQLKSQFDLVVIDGPAGLHAVAEESRAFDTALIVRDCDATQPAEINALSYRLREEGVQGVGVIENFH